MSKRVGHVATGIWELDSGRYLARVRPPGTTKDRSKTFDTLEEAQVWRDQMRTPAVRAREITNHLSNEHHSITDQLRVIRTLCAWNAAALKMIAHHLGTTLEDDT
jgi:hypothetical protein